MKHTPLFRQLRGFGDLCARFESKDQSRLFIPQHEGLYPAKRRSPSSKDQKQTQCFICHQAALASVQKGHIWDTPEKMTAQETRPRRRLSGRRTEEPGPSGGQASPAHTGPETPPHPRHHFYRTVQDGGSQLEVTGPPLSVGSSQSPGLPRGQRALGTLKQRPLRAEWTGGRCRGQSWGKWTATVSPAAPAEVSVLAAAAQPLPWTTERGICWGRLGCGPHPRAGGPDPPRPER